MQNRAFCLTAVLGCLTRLAAVWTALFLNLLMAMLLGWLICAAVWLAGTYPNTRLVAAGCLALAILATGYGVWNAYHPVVKKLKIEFSVFVV